MKEPLMAKETAVVTVYPVPGLSLAGVPAVPLAVDKATAERLIRTGAFSSDGDGEATPLPEGAQLDFYDYPGEPGSHYKTFKGGPPPGGTPAETTGPADAGPSDSSEG